jgi:hypothetical protein
MNMGSRRVSKARRGIGLLFQIGPMTVIVQCRIGILFPHFSQQLDLRSVMNETKATTSNFKLKFGMNDYDQSFTVDDVSTQ